MASEIFSTADVIAGYRRAVAEDQRRILRLMESAAEQHLTAVRRSYPLGPTGHLRTRITLDRRNAFSWRVLATAPHLGLYERGTRPRRTRAGASRGVSPAHGAVFIPLAIRYRAQAGSAVRALLERPVEV